MNLKKRFLRVFYKLPLEELKYTVVILDGEPMSWKVVKQEVDQMTSVGDECLSKLAEMGII